MRLRAILFASAALAATAGLSALIADRAVAYVERMTERQLSSALAAAGQDWAEIIPDGARVVLGGEAPDEASRFRAIEVAARIVDQSRLIDRMGVAPERAIAAPDFRLEILRSPGTLSLIGLVPADAGPAIEAARGGLGAGLGVTDMVEAVDHPVPAGWAEALGTGIALAAEVEQAKIAITPGAVSVLGVAPSPEARDALIAALSEAAPASVTLDLEITAPKPVISPFALEVTLGSGGLGVGACAATEEAAAAALAAALESLGADAVTCKAGLGAPGEDWDHVAAEAVALLGRLGAGRLAMENADIRLIGPRDMDPAAFEARIAGFRDTLPAPFSLRATLPTPSAEPDAAEATPAPELVAALDDSGRLTLEGPVSDRSAQIAIVTFAESLFGADRVVDRTTLDAALPDGWPQRALAGIEGLSLLDHGTMTLSPDTLGLSGQGLVPDIERELLALLDEKLAHNGIEYRLSVAYNPAAAERAALSRPERCDREIAEILSAEPIVFDPGSASLTDRARATVERIGRVLDSCPGTRWEIGGHTDSQGPAATNQRISEARAVAVMDALIQGGADLVYLSARGYGEEKPIADNATEAGRALNRRIAFTLMPDPEELARIAAEEAAAAEAKALAVAEALAALEAGAPLPADVSLGAVCEARIEAILAEEQILFEVNAATIDAESLELVQTIADVFADCPGTEWEIGGHTDSQGRLGFNMEISERRAQSVKARLDEMGLDAITLTARGYGPEKPIADNDTEEGRALNRRITFKLLEAPDIAAAEVMGEAEPAAALPAPVMPADTGSLPEEAEAEAGATADAAMPAALAAIAPQIDPEAVLDPDAAPPGPTLPGSALDAAACDAAIAELLAEDQILFALNSAEIEADSAALLDEIAARLADCPGTEWEIGGHTDSFGSASFNQELSEERAEAVRAALAERPELEGVVLTARGYGQDDPIADNATPEGRALNRRIAFTLLAPLDTEAADEDADSDAGDGSGSD